MSNIQTLTPFQMGEYNVSVTYERMYVNNDKYILFTATTGDTTITNSMEVAPKHDRTIDQLKADIIVHGQRLAMECAGRENNRQHHEILFGGRNEKA